MICSWEKCRVPEWIDTVTLNWRNTNQALEFNHSGISWPHKSLFHLWLCLFIALAGYINGTWSTWSWISVLDGHCGARITCFTQETEQSTKNKIFGFTTTRTCYTNASEQWCNSFHIIAFIEGNGMMFLRTCLFWVILGDDRSGSSSLSNWRWVRPTAHCGMKRTLS